MTRYKTTDAVLCLVFGMLLYSGLGRLVYGPRAQAQEAAYSGAQTYRLQERQVQALEHIASTLDKIERKLKP